jgi:hypothetical protein
MARFIVPKTVEIRGEDAPVTNGYRFRKSYRSRRERAEQLVANGCVHKQGDGVYFVESASARLQGIEGQGYHVYLRIWGCECPDAEKNADNPFFEGCMHFQAADIVQRQERNAARQSKREAVGVAR